MIKQPILNIGCLGSVSDGKSTLVLQLTGIKTQRHSNEQTRNITIKPGYANMKVWFNNNNEYITSNSDTDFKDAKLIHHLSFVDCPGHQELILTMMGSVSLMKGAIVVVSASESISKKPQLIQHLAAVKIANIKKVIIIFNKLDLITKEKALECKAELDELLLKLDIKPQYIIPASLNKKIGIQNIIKAIMEVFPPEVDSSEPKNIEFKITRSFDVNKPGTNWDKITGGIFGGSLISGEFKVGDEIEIRPGNWSIKKDGSFMVIPIRTTIKTIQTDKVSLDILSPGGLIAIGTDIDPFYCKNDKLAGATVGLVGATISSVYQYITMNIILTPDFGSYGDIKKNDILYLQIGNVNTEAKVHDIQKIDYIFKLSKPVCINRDTLIVVCNTSAGDILRIIGYGNLNYSSSNVLL